MNNAPLKRANPLPIEMLAVADSLRHIEAQMKFLLRQAHPASGFEECYRIIADASGLATALEAMAQRLAEK